MTSPAAPVPGPGALHRIGRAAALLVVPLLVTACAGTPPASVSPPVPERWQAPLPAGADAARTLDWWARFDDPLLASTVAAAEQASPTLASAAARIAEARAARTAAAATLWPSLDAGASASRGRSDLSLPGIAESRGVSLQTAWELDLFGRNRSATRAAAARLDASLAQAHAARTAVAAEAADTYVALRACEARLAQARLDAVSRGETARLTELSMRAGFTSRADAALAQAGSAQARTLASQQALACDQLVNALVALTALDATTLKARLAARTATLPLALPLAVPALPAEVLAQRPDVHAGALAVAAASADVSAADAARWPRVTLAGSIGHVRTELAGVSVDGRTWTLGPVAVTLPLFDAGRRAADADAARARYDEAASQYAATLRGAIREVEDALSALQSTAAREADARLAAAQFEASFRGVEARRQSGFASLFELEDARRQLFVAQNALVDLQRERVAAWIALYRALGGGWDAAASSRATFDPGPAATPAASRPSAS